MLTTMSLPQSVWAGADGPPSVRRKIHRHLASPEDVIGSLSEAISDVSAGRIHSRAWPELCFVDASFVLPGDVFVPPAAFYAVGTVVRGVAYIREAGDDVQQAPRIALEGATRVHPAARAFHYAWAVPHQSHLACLDSALVRSAATESGIGDPTCIDITSSFDVRDSVCEYLLMVLAEEAKLSAHAAQPMIVQSVASALALRLVGRFRASGPQPLGARGALTGRVFAQVRAYIEDNVGEPISLEDLARVAGISRFHFARQFRLRTGESPMGYLLRSRIERAKPMLRATNTKVSEIAATLGFADQSHFTRTFKRLVGMSPTAFSGIYKFRGGVAPDEVVPDARRDEWFSR